MPADDPAQSTADRILETVDRLPLAPSILGGITAFVGGFFLFVATLASTGNPNFSNPVRTLKQIGGIFYNAQNVHLRQYREIVVGDQTIPQEATINLLQQSQPTLPRIVYYAIPVVALAVVSGFLIHRYVDDRRPLETLGAIVLGTTVGYVLASLIGTFLVTQRTAIEGASESLGPVKVESLVFGIAYPLAITLVIGAIVIALYHRRSVTERIERVQA